MVMRLLACTLFLSSCLKNKTLKPEEVLNDYITYSLSVGQTRQKLLEFTAGQMKARIENLSNSEFNRYVNTDKNKIKSFKVLHKTCSETVCSITYALSYTKRNGEALLSEIKKVADLVLIEGVWKITDVSTVKTYFESETPIQVP